MTRYAWSTRLALAVLLLFGAHARAGTPALQRLPGHELDALARATRLVPAPDADATPLTVTLVLRRDDEAGFERHLAAMRGPVDARPRAMSQRELADRFGPSRRTYDRVAQWLRRHDLVVVQEARNRLTLSVRGSRAAVARAFDVRIDDYRLDDRVFRANDGDPALPVGLAEHVQAVTGLSDLGQPRPVTRTLRRGFYKLVCNLLLAPIPPPTGFKICTAGGVNPYKLCITAAEAAAAADADFNFDFTQFSGYLTYNQVVPVAQPCPPDTSPLFTGGTPPRPRAVSGAGQRIAILGFDSYRRSDIADYLALMGFPASNIDRLSDVPVNGGAPLGPEQSEQLLDVTTVMTVAPGADVVTVHSPFAGAGSFQALFNAALDAGATIVSNSWSYCEDQTSLADVQGIDAVFQSAAAAGVSIFNASGDTGSTCLNGSPNTVGVPSGAPNATAVGGSSVQAAPGRQYGSETWWDGSASIPPTGQGGFGTSRFFTRPAYQDGFTTSPMRSVPDVVANADPVNGVMICQADDGGCPTGALFGGTSFTAPLWAAYTAIINEQVGTNLGFANAALYPLAATPAFNPPAALASDFAHVGLGSPNVDAMIVQLTATPVLLPDAGVSLVSPGIVTQNVTLTAQPVQVPADGTSTGFVTVTLLDTNRHAVGGKTVSLTGSPSGSVQITPPTVVADARGVAVFTVSNLTAENVEFTATDTTDGIELATTPIMPFVVPPAASGGIVASVDTVDANGVASTTLTVTLKDALDRPTPGKLVTLAQGDGHSVITAPNPSVTDVNGQIAFVATNRVNEVVTYTAIDVTDGNLPVPGSAVVTWANGNNTSCGSTAVPPVGQNGYVVTPFATGFFAQAFNYGNVNWGCTGATNPAFGASTVYIAQFPDGALYGFGLGGGSVSSANLLSTIGPTLAGPVFGKDGRLYAQRGSTGVNFTTGAIVELDPVTGAQLRVVAANQTCPTGLAVDPISGDLFFTGGCFGAGADDPILHRIADPASATPTVSTYATLPRTPNGQVAFTPNGTIYVQTGYNDPSPAIVRVSGTNSPTPGVITPVDGVTSFFFVAVAAVGPAGDASALLTLQSGDLTLVDLAVTPPANTVLATDLPVGSIGPDGCLYAGAGDAVYKLTNAVGGCDFLPSTATPSLSLSPSLVSPHPAQGTTQTLTATFRNLTVPAGTPVFFDVAGANPRVQMVRTNDAGEAALTYLGGAVGADAIVASATVDGTSYTSNTARITWTPGTRPTFLTLNPSPRASVPGQQTTVAASLSDVSTPNAAPIAGVPVRFTLGIAECTGTTDATGLASCALASPLPGAAVLTATFAGTEAFLPASDSVGFAVVVAAPSTGPFLVFDAKASRGAKFYKFGPITLADGFGSGGYDVVKPTALGVPAATNGDPLRSVPTSLAGYAVKRAKGAAKFQKRSQRVVGACTDTTASVKKPATLMVPSLTSSQTPPVDGLVDHYLCYAVKAKGGVAKGAQVDVGTGAATTRWDLKKLSLLCNPVDKSGAPTVLAGPDKKAPFPITPATVRTPNVHLLCYQAKVAKRRIEQTGCGPTTPKDKGTPIKPAQPKPAGQSGVQTANQFGVRPLDAKKATLVCLPAAAP